MTPLLYTLGSRDIYEPYLTNDPRAAKAPGGTVWRTREEVDAYLAKNPLFDYSVYGVMAVWGVSTRLDPKGDGIYHELLVEAPLRRV